MDNNLFNRYGLAYLNLAIEENKVEEYRKEAKELKVVFHDNPLFIRLLSTTNIEKVDRYQVVDDTFKDFSLNTRNFIKVIIKNNRAHFLDKIFKETVYRFDDYLEIEQGTIISAIPLSEENKNSIIQAIEKNTKKKIELKEVVDKDLIGGFKVILKNDIYDATIIRKLKALKDNLLDNGGK